MFLFSFSGLHLFYLQVSPPACEQSRQCVLCAVIFMVHVGVRVFEVAARERSHITFTSLLYLWFAEAGGQQAARAHVQVPLLTSVIQRIQSGDPPIQRADDHQASVKNQNTTISHFVCTFVTLQRFNKNPTCLVRSKISDLSNLTHFAKSYLF